MLVLFREIGESIIVGDLITITILDIHDLDVQIVVQAPPEICVHNEEDH